MAKISSILETMLASGVTDGGDMTGGNRGKADLPVRLGGAGVSLFGHPRRAPAIPPALVDERLRTALLPPRHDPERIWADLPEFRLDPEAADGAHLIQIHRNHPVGLLFDHLRTRVLQAMQERGWTRIAVAAPTKGCGASTVAANLALALARRPSGRTLLLDLDLRAPSQAGMFGLSAPGALRDVLDGTQPMESQFVRIGRTLALGLNGRSEADSAEFLQEPATADALDAILEDLSPDIAIYDLPPVLETDDVLAILPEVDAVLLVADGTRTLPEHIRDCERLFEGHTQLLGVVLNRAEDSPAVKR